ncbi:MAG: Asp23/Gls24 family envelope stress response protein [Candidatus Bipolaricaulota bacterium]
MAERKEHPETEEEFTQEVASGSGAISISRDVIATIAGLAAAEVEGVTTPRGGQLRKRKGEAAKRQVETAIDGGEVKVAIKVGIVYGYQVSTVAQELQERVKAEIERMTGLQVRSVDVEVTRLLFPEEGEQTEEV